VTGDTDALKPFTRTSSASRSAFSRFAKTPSCTPHPPDCELPAGGDAGAAADACPLLCFCAAGFGWVAFAAGAVVGFDAAPAFEAPEAVDVDVPCAGFAGACAPLLTGGLALAELPPCGAADELVCPVAAGESHVDDSLRSLSEAVAPGDPACAVGCAGSLGCGSPLGWGGPEVPAAPFAV
jgi:hypothetical protein